MGTPGARALDERCDRTVVAPSPGSESPSPAPSPARSLSPGYVVAAAVTVLLALYAAFAKLSTASLAYDEPIYRRAGWRYVQGLTRPATKLPNGTWRIALPDDFEHPPLAKYLFGLAQAMVGRESVVAARTVAAGCVVLAGVILMVWLGRSVGRWSGLVVFALVTLLPQHGLMPDTLARHIYLEPVAALFLTASVVSAWSWFSVRSLRRSWLFAVVTGVLVGLATSAKEVGFLGVVGPVLLGGVLSARQGGRRLAVIRAAQAVAAAGAAGAVFLALYLPVGAPATLVDYMIDYQRRQSASGHMVEVAGRLYEHPPWWANLWFVWHSLGAVLAAVLVLLAVAGTALRRDRLVGWLAAGLAGPLIYLCLVSSFALPYYWTVCAPLFFALAAIGAVELARFARAGWASRRPAAVTGAVALFAAGVVLVVSAGQLLSGIATLRPNGVKAAALVERRLGSPEPTLLVAVPVVTMREYLSSKLLHTSVPASPGRIGYVAVGCDRRVSVAPNLQAMLAANLAANRLVEVYRDRFLKLYRVTSPLEVPSGAGNPAPGSSGAPAKLGKPRSLC